VISVAGGILVYVLAFTLVHAFPELRHLSSDGNWYYSDKEVVENIEFYGFWPLRQLSYAITKTEHRHISESLPISLPDGI